ncbi:hypothetical protein MHYP_G00092760 [Metynnis hypsauchen]
MVLKHVLSFRRQVFMFLNRRQLRRTGSPPQPSQTAEVEVTQDPGQGTSSAWEVNCGGEVSEHLVAEKVQESEGDQQQAGQGECVTDVGVSGECFDVVDSGEVAGPNDERCSAGCVLVSESQSESVVLVEEGMDEEDRLSEVSDAGGSQFSSEMLYTVDQVNSFLDETKGRPVDVSKFFPDLDKFVCSVLKVQRSVGYDGLSQQKRFRLKKHVTVVRKVNSAKSRAGSDRMNV